MNIDNFSPDTVPKNDFVSPIHPLPEAPPRPTPAWVALASAWLGLFTLIAAIILPFLPGSRNPRAELEHAAGYSPADKFLPAPIYASVVAMFLGVIVLWQMRKEPRPLPQALVNQKLQACVGIGLALCGAIGVYIFVALRGPR